MHLGKAEKERWQWNEIPGDRPAVRVRRRQDELAWIDAAPWKKRQIMIGA